VSVWRCRTAAGGGCCSSCECVSGWLLAAAVNARAGSVWGWAWCCGGGSSSCEHQSLWAGLRQLVTRGPSQRGAVKAGFGAAGVCCLDALRQAGPQTFKILHGCGCLTGTRHPHCFVVAAVCSGDVLFVTDKMTQQLCKTVACGCQSLLESKTASVWPAGR